MSLYGQYIKERTNKHILENDNGFVVYSYPQPQVVYIEDIFVNSDNRSNHLATEMANQVIAEAKDKGCIKALGSVVPSANNSTISLKVLLAYGMSLDSATNDFILFKKDLV